MADITRQEQCDYVKGELEDCLQEMTDIVNRLLMDKGDTCDTSQKICIYQAINHLEHNINGIDPTDVKFEGDQDILDSYDNEECPDCCEPIPSNVEEGDNCHNCGHVFSVAREVN